MLDQLKELTSDPSPEGRRKLLHSITDLFLVEVEPNESAKDHYATIANLALPSLQSPDRTAYAERVAAAPTLPSSVAKRLAGDDDVAVASLVLRLSPVLTDADLAAIAVTHSQAHLVAIAERASLSETVTEVLVERGDGEVLRTVSGNEGAQFSDHGMTRLIERGAADPQVSRNLTRRAEQLPPAQAQRVLQITTQVSGGAGAATPQTAVRQARQRRLEVKILMVDLKEKRRSMDDVVRMLCEEDRAFDLAQVMASAADLPSPQVLKALLQPDASGIAVAAKSLGLSTAAFQAVLTLRAARLGQPSRQVEQDAAAYAELAGDVSDRAMRFLKVRSAMH